MWERKGKNKTKNYESNRYKMIESMKDEQHEQEWKINKLIIIRVVTNCQR